jgi:hypothetical protein
MLSRRCLAVGGAARVRLRLCSTSLVPIAPIVPAVPNNEHMATRLAKPTAAGGKVGVSGSLPPLLMESTVHHRRSCRHRHSSTQALLTAVLSGKKGRLGEELMSANPGMGDLTSFLGNLHLISAPAFNDEQGWPSEPGL